jgi:predicted AAA+ superfamily ATPase
MRNISTQIKIDLQRKLILLTGPRQSGKTTLASSLSKSTEYLNFDIPEDRVAIIQKSWDRRKTVLVLDELHKLKNWKLFLKGVVDSQQHNQQTIVTGSARLDVARKVGDSLAGRYLLFHLHPIDVKEAVNFFSMTPAEALRRIMLVSGFPEPFLQNDQGEYRRWRTTHSDIILRQDLIQLETVEQLTQIETLVQLMRDRVGSPLAYANLAEDLGCAPKTVKRWLEILENLYVVFRIRPYSRKVPRAIVKAPKFYFYDCAMVNDEGARFENVVALSLKKEIDYRRDCFGDQLDLNFVRNRNGDEIDFLVSSENKPWLALEAKLSDDAPHRPFKVFHENLKFSGACQLVANLKRDKTFDTGLELRSAADWLSKIDLARTLDEAKKK